MRSRQAAIAAVLLLLSAPLFGQNCPRLMSLHLMRAHVVSASLESGANVDLLRKTTSPVLPTFCRVKLTARPTSGSLIHIEIWLPQNNWNGRLVSSGNGGFAGTLDYPQLASGLRHSFVSVNSDAGTFPATPENGDALIGHRQRWEDWGGRAVHVMTSLAKRVVTAYYGKGPSTSYFRGCSTGGEQGLAEAQRYPGDYDGILSGAPANNRVRLHIAILWNFEALTRGQQAGLTQEHLAFLHQAVLRSCPAHTVADDALSDPSRCAFDPQLLLCSEIHARPCLNQTEIDAVKQIYTGPQDGKGRSIYPGLERGSELGWLAANNPEMGVVPFGSIFKWVWGPRWDWQRFDFDRDTETMEKQLGASVNATSTNLRAFQQRRNKLILYHGWNDPLIAPMGSVQYYERVNSSLRERHFAGTTELIDTAAFLRLYMIPGLKHCSGGSSFKEDELFSKLIDWVEKGTAPSAPGISSGAVAQ